MDEEKKAFDDRAEAETESAEQDGGKISKAAILEELKNVMDPELMLNVVDLGLVYKVETTEDSVEVDFSLTYPGCPAGEHIRRDIERTVQDFTGLDDVTINIVWDPPWQADFMSEEARVVLGYPI